MAKSKGITKKIVAGALALAVAAGSVCLLGYISRDTNGNWFGSWTNNGLTDGNGNGGGPVISDGESSGMVLAATAIPLSAYEEYGVSAQAESASIITATITPEATTNKNVTWSCNDTSGKVTVTAVESNPLQAVVTVSGAFNKQVTITCTLEANTAIKSSLTVDYVKDFNGATAPDKSFTHIADIDIDKLPITFGTGTLTPTSVTGDLEISLESAVPSSVTTKWAIQRTKTYTQAEHLENWSTITFDNLFLQGFTEAQKKQIYEDIAIANYGKTNVNFMYVNISNTHAYYNGVETSFYEDSLTDFYVTVQNFSDIYVNPTGVSLSDGSLIFGANGIIT